MQNRKKKPVCPIAKPEAVAGKEPNLRVLIVDDERLERTALQILVGSEPGFELAGIARDGHDAICQVKRLEPDLVLLDVELPGLNGVEVLEQLGPNAPLTIFTTGNPTIGARAFDLNAVDYLLKPFTRARFRLALEKARQRFQLAHLPCVE